MKRSIITLLALLALFGAAAAVPALQIEIPDWENAVRFELVASQEPVRPGDSLELAVVADIQEGYHLYGPEEEEPNRTQVTVVGDTLQAGEPTYPPVIRRDLAGLGEYDLYEGTLAIRIPVTVPKSFAAKSLEAAVEVAYQICTDFACSAPEREVFTIELPGAVAGAPVKPARRDIFKKNEE